MARSTLPGASWDPSIIGQLKQVSGVTVGTVPGGAIRYLIINHTMKPMDDPNVVKAMASAIDRNQIADTVYGGQVHPAVLDGPAWIPRRDAKPSTRCTPRRTWIRPRNIWLLLVTPRAIR